MILTQQKPTPTGTCSLDYMEFYCVVSIRIAVDN